MRTCWACPRASTSVSRACSDFFRVQNVAKRPCGLKSGRPENVGISTFSGLRPLVPPVGLEPTCSGSATTAVIVGIWRFSLAGVVFMRPRPFFQSLPVFTCFERGLRFFVSKLCPNSMDARLKLPPQSSTYIYRIVAASYPATLDTGSSPVSMSSSVPSRSALTRRMRGSASISSSVHHV